MQTASAILGYRTVLTPLSLSSEWLVRLLVDDETWQVPASLVYIVVLVWMIVASGRVLHAALEWPMTACVALVVLELIGSWFVLLNLLPGLR